MSVIEDWISELKREAESTRALLEQLPEDKFSWRPHPISMSLGQLALHVAGVPGGLALLLDDSVSEVPVVPLPEPTNRQELLDALERSISLAESKLRAWGEDALRDTWRLGQHGGDRLGNASDRDGPHADVQSCLSSSGTVDGLSPPARITGSGDIRPERGRIISYHLLQKV